MARDEKPVRLRPIDEDTEIPVPVVRLENLETEAVEKPVRLVPDIPHSESNTLLEIPSRDDIDLRTHQPDMESLLDGLEVNPETVEEAWDETTRGRSSLPWGWFVLIGLCVASAAIWSLLRVQQGKEHVEKEMARSVSLIDAEEAEAREAARLVDRIDEAVRGYFSARSVDGLIRRVRHSERVGPVMKEFYQRNPIEIKTVRAIRSMQHITLGNRGNFMRVDVVLSDGSNQSMFVEIFESGEPKIDWETLVGYQPMDWDKYVEHRPQGESMDFRVVVSADSFYSHEFADSDKWASFKLTARGGEEPLFGYARKGGDLERSLLELIRQNQGKPVSLILRLTIPSGIHSRRGVVIERLMSARWIYIESPDAGA